MLLARLLAHYTRLFQPLLIALLEATGEGHRWQDKYNNTWVIIA